MAIILPTNLMLNGVMTGVTTIVSNPLDCIRMPYVAFECVWTGTPVGAFSVDGSLGTTDINGNLLWYPTGTVINDNPSGSADQALINIGFPIGFRYIRVSYTNISGVGVLNINGMAKSGGGAG